ncbi:anther-specific proline-rich protein APG-like [Hibiscus syriacus]|uniref:anther-specific proline-rich protein APG-like n=1 Tax=Hibiscus syriacus TaxID=106335 RepID=UPI0019214522|nr:anther-specific proline-rich protein APG-like [Hibiscus syriacus]
MGGGNEPPREGLSRWAAANQEEEPRPSPPPLSLPSYPPPRPPSVTTRPPGVSIGAPSSPPPLLPLFPPREVQPLWPPSPTLGPGPSIPGDVSLEPSASETTSQAEPGPPNGKQATMETMRMDSWNSPSACASDDCFLPLLFDDAFVWFSGFNIGFLLLP